MDSKNDRKSEMTAQNNQVSNQKSMKLITRGGYHFNTFFLSQLQLSSNNSGSFHLTRGHKATQVAKIAHQNYGRITTTMFVFSISMSQSFSSRQKGDHTMDGEDKEGLLLWVYTLKQMLLLFNSLNRFCHSTPRISHNLCDFSNTFFKYMPCNLALFGSSPVTSQFFDCLALFYMGGVNLPPPIDKAENSKNIQAEGLCTSDFQFLSISHNS